MVNTQGTVISSLIRAVDLLRVLPTIEPEQRRAARIAKETGIGRSTTYHILNTLVATRLLVKHTDGTYGVGPLFEVLANSLGGQQSRAPEVLHALRTLTNITGETSYFSMERHGVVSVLAANQGSRQLNIRAPLIGFSGHEHARASGKLFIAYNESVRNQFLGDGIKLKKLTDDTITDPAKLSAQSVEIRSLGYAIEDGEFAPGVACIAAPVFIWGHLYGALTLSAPSQRVKADRQQLVAATREVASQLEADLEQEQTVRNDSPESSIKEKLA